MSAAPESLSRQAEPATASPPQASGLRHWLLFVAANYGLLVFGLALAILFALLLPETFASAQTFRAILANNTTVAFLGLAEMIVIATGNYDLSIAYGLGLMHIFAMALMVDYHVNWIAACLIVLAAGAGVGLLNGVLVEFAKIDSFIATLGVGTVMYGLGAWYTGGGQLVGDLSPGFVFLNDGFVLGIPLPALLVAILALGMWLTFEYLPAGRRLYAIGSNRKASDLIGIPTRRLVISGFVASGAIVALSALILAARLQVGQSAVGPEFLLPGFVGALLGSTTVRPGRVNVIGTIIAVLVLAVGIAGLQQLGGAFFVEPIFDGVTLVVSVGLAGYAARRRRR